MRTLLVALLVAATLSGCFGDDDPAAKPPAGGEDVAKPYVTPFALEHDHGDPTIHDIANNVTLVGHHPLGENGPPGSISEIDVAGNWAFLGVMGWGFMIVDISDPADPELVSSVEVLTPDHQTPLGAYVADLKVDSGGDWVFVALELSTTPGVLIYDARDKANPVFAGFWPEPGLLLGCHMIEYARIAESEYLFCAPLDNAVYVGLLLPPVGNTREIVQVARWMPATPKFAQQQADVLLGYLQAQDPVSAALHWVSGHQDMTHQKDPLTGADILSVSFWNLGLRFVDVSIPAVPVEVGSWAGEASQKWDGVLHTAMMFESEGRRIAVTIPEGANPPALFVLDATDYDDPMVLSEWAAHDDFRGESGAYSMHNFQIIGGRVYVMMYHGGLGIFDISTPELQKAPVLLGSYLPWDRAGGDVNATRYGAGCCGGSWDVVVYQGYAVMANRGGLFVVQFDGEVVGEDGLTSFA